MKQARLRALLVARALSEDEPVGKVLRGIEALSAAEQAESGSLPDCLSRLGLPADLRALAAAHPPALCRTDAHMDTQTDTFSDAHTRAITHSHTEANVNTHAHTGMHTDTTPKTYALMQTFSHRSTDAQSTQDCT